MDELNNESSKELFEKRLGERHLQEDYLPEEDEETSIVRTVASLEVEATTLMNDIALLNGKLDQLRNLQNIVETQGPSRITMQALQDIVGERVLPDNIPVAAFTMQSSELHKDIAMQSLDGAFGGLLAKVIQFIAKYIKVIIAAIIGLVMLVIGLGGSGSSGGGGGGGGGSSSVRTTVRVPGSAKQLDVRKSADWQTLCDIHARAKASLGRHPDIEERLIQLMNTHRNMHNTLLDEEIFEALRTNKLHELIDSVHRYAVELTSYGSTICVDVSALADSGRAAMEVSIPARGPEFVNDLASSAVRILKRGILGYTLTPLGDSDFAKEMDIQVPEGILNGTILLPSQVDKRKSYWAAVELETDDPFGHPRYMKHDRKEVALALEQSRWLSAASETESRDHQFYDPQKLDNATEELAKCSMIHAKSAKLLEQAVNGLDQRSKTVTSKLNKLAEKAKAFKLPGVNNPKVAQWPPRGAGTPDYVSQPLPDSQMPDGHRVYDVTQVVKATFSLTGGPCRIAIDALKVIGAQAKDAKQFLDASDRVVRDVFEYRLALDSALRKIVEAESKL